MQSQQPSYCLDANRRTFVRVVKRDARSSGMSMNYTNEHGVRFKVAEHPPNMYTVKYYPGTPWPRTYSSFHCPTDERRREMFFVLNNLRLCTTCNDEVLGYRVDSDRTVCKKCALRNVLTSGTPGEDIPDCPVCYQKMLAVDYSKVTLPCRHDLCRYCISRMTRNNSSVLTCPLCRSQSFHGR